MEVELFKRSGPLVSLQKKGASEMEVESVLLALLLINALAFSQLNLAVEAAESVPLSPSDDFSKGLKALSRRSRRITPPSPRINAPVQFKRPPLFPRRPPPPRSPPPPCLWRPPTPFG
ncbi:hypothetical protein ERO13_D11G296648v2 [Gossypium hirsutum]|nr:hypothetical protein ERO13_D11G296648v2 [Gossypium hirsutum]